LPIHSECGGGGGGGGNDGVGGGGESDVEEKMLLVSTRITNIHILSLVAFTMEQLLFSYHGKVQLLAV
jgi:hypothetical protein